MPLALKPDLKHHKGEPPPVKSGSLGKNPKDRKLALVAIAVGAVGVVVTVVLARRNAAAASSGANGTAGIDPTTGLPYTYPVVGGAGSSGYDPSGAIAQLGQGFNAMDNANANASAALQGSIDASSQANQSALAAMQAAFTSGLAQLSADIHSQGAPATAGVPAQSDASLYQTLTQEVGALAARTGIGANPGQVAQWQQMYSGESGLQQQFDIEAQNVGFLTSFLKGSGRPASSAALLPAAEQMAGGTSAWSALDPFAQQTYLQRANIAAYQTGLTAGTVQKR